MKIAIIGASGFVGTELVKEAVRRNHKVTGIARHADKINSDSNLVTTQAVDVFDVESLAKVLKNHDAVINAIKPGSNNPDQYSDLLKGYKNTQEAVKKAGVDRYLVVGGAGSLYDESGNQLVDSPEFPEDYKPIALAARDYLDIIKKEKELKWTYLSPAVLLHPGIDTGRTGKYRVGTEHPVFDDKGESKISAEDIAVALLDELENGNYIQKRFTVAY